MAVHSGGKCTPVLNFDSLTVRDQDIVEVRQEFAIFKDAGADVGHRVKLLWQRNTTRERGSGWVPDGWMGGKDAKVAAGTHGEIRGEIGL